MKLHFGKKKEEKKVYPPNKPNEVIDTIQEQIEKPMTTIYCPESVTAEKLKQVAKNPRNYIEINIIKKIRVVDSFYIPSNLKEFKYKNEPYNIDEGKIYLLPTKSDYLMPTSFYYEGDILHNPIDFKNLNQGITGKELSLLYDEELFKGLFPFNETKYNLFIVILSIFSLGSYWIGIYMLFAMG